MYRTIAEPNVFLDPTCFFLFVAASPLRTCFCSSCIPSLPPRSIRLPRPPPSSGVRYSRFSVTMWGPLATRWRSALPLLKQEKLPFYHSKSTRETNVANRLKIFSPTFTILNKKESERITLFLLLFRRFDTSFVSCVALIRTKW